MGWPVRQRQDRCELRVGMRMGHGPRRVDVRQDDSVSTHIRMMNQTVPAFSWLFRTAPPCVGLVLRPAGDRRGTMLKAMQLAPLSEYGVG